MTAEFHFYRGLDWATEQHQACIMDSQGQVLAQRKIEHSGMRNALYHWARTSVQHDARSKQQYARLRAAGRSHGRALRGVADGLLTALIATLKSGQP